jgi:uncharacterized protein YciI
MKYFLLEGEHLVRFEEFRHLEPAHHAFLQKGYDDGFFLFSGLQIPAHGVAAYPQGTRYAIHNMKHEKKSWRN